MQLLREALAREVEGAKRAIPRWAARAAHYKERTERRERRERKDQQSTEHPLLCQSWQIILFFMSRTETALTVIVTDSFRSAHLRRVFFTMPNVAPRGADWASNHGGRHFELTSFKGGAVEVYLVEAGLATHMGTVAQYAPGGGCLLAALRSAWYSAQPSKAAREAFEASAVKS